MTPTEWAARLREHFGERVGELVPGIDPFVVVKTDAVLEVARFAKRDPSLAIDVLQDLTVTDHPKEGLLRVVQHWYSHTHGHLLVVKTELDRMAPQQASMEPVWKAAGWLEREAYDLFGVVFEGHGDLRRVMLPSDWVGHPLRKDYVEQGGYRGISNVRDNPLDQFLALDKSVRTAGDVLEAKAALDAARAEIKS